MTNKLEIYKCEICGNIVQIFEEGAGELVCCGEEMKLLEPQREESELGEKHIPEFSEREGRRYVAVLKHPMVKEHYIEFIETYTKDKNELHVKFFHPEERAEMDITELPHEMNAIEYCNIHNLWGN